MARKEFELTNEQYAKLIEACRPVALIALQCGMPRSPQQNANDAWCALGRELGFDGMTVEGSPKGDRFFTAEVSDEPANDLIRDDGQFGAGA